MDDEKEIINHYVENLIELIKNQKIMYFEQLDKKLDIPPPPPKPKKFKGIRCPRCNSKKYSDTEKPGVLWCLKCHKEFEQNGKT